ncbi:hypothetical protein G6011_01116 [Alternaria panax]|uniref:Uncharacterized protein n=1 Tax=Alternaria panax TaxID=48097 RepID=A0AAD4IK77_9PLEO|nr:hypothetical protein G6011_01116 [Alternaria panax]
MVFCTEDPRKSVEFLSQKCEESGVNILFGSEIHRIQIGQEELTGVTIKQGNDFREIGCGTLVIAAES